MKYVLLKMKMNYCSWLDKSAEGVKLSEHEKRNRFFRRRALEDNWK